MRWSREFRERLKWLKGSTKVFPRLFHAPYVRSDWKPCRNLPWLLQFAVFNRRVIREKELIGAPRNLGAESFDGRVSIAPTLARVYPVVAEECRTTHKQLLLLRSHVKDGTDVLLDGGRNVPGKMKQADLMRRGTRLGFLFFIAVLSMTGCSRKVEPAMLVGRWVLTDESLRSSAVRGAIGSIELRDNNTFSAQNFPGTALFIPTDSKWPLSFHGSGAWSLGIRQDRQVLLLRFDDLFDVKSGVRLPYETYETALTPSGSGSSLLLYYYEGDPDEGKRIYFKKTH